MENNEIAVREETTAIATQVESTEGTGFEEASNEDLIIPRLKVINALSPERLDGIAEEGMILNTLTQEDCRGKRFIPIKVYYSNIEWNPDRDDEDNRMFCTSRDGITGTILDKNAAECGQTRLCKQCRRNQFDNTKSGSEAKPKCTGYMNFLGFFSDSPLPVVISFSRTNYNEGRKFLSLAKSLRTSLWSYAYTFDSKQVTKGKNRWYNITVTLSEATTQEEREIASAFFMTYRDAQINAEIPDDEAVEEKKSVVVTPDEEEF